MSLWLKGAIEEIDCEGEGCPFCPYQIYPKKETWACVGDNLWNGVYMAIKLWRLMNHHKKADRLSKIMGEKERDEEGTQFMNLNQLQDSISLMAGLREELYDFTGNKHFRFNPDEIDWDMQKYSDLITHWKNPDGTEVYTLVNALYRAKDTEYYFREALRRGKPVLFDSFD